MPHVTPPDSRNEILTGIAVPRRILDAVVVVWNAIPTAARGALVLAVVMLAASVASVAVLLFVLRG
jgi:hypothetical protein